MLRMYTLNSRPTLACLALVLPLAAQAQLSPIDQVVFEAQALSASAAPRLVLSSPASAVASNMSLAALPPPQPAAPVEIEAGEEDVERYLATIAAAELAEGPFAVSQLEPWLALGRIYQQQGDHEAALEALGKAEYISRINAGLYAPEQFAIVEAMIASHLAVGEIQEANQKQQYLLFIQQEYYGEESLEVVPALETLANWNMDAFRSVLNQVNTAGFAIGLNTRAGGNGRVSNPRALAFGNLFVAQRNYYQAIVNLVSNRDFRNPQLPQLEYNLIEAIFLAANREGILNDPDFYLDRRGIHTGSRIRRDPLTGSSLNFINGRNAWQRMRIYLESDPTSSPEQVAQAIIGQGDWHLLFHRPTMALDFYREARTYLQRRQVPESTIAALLSPAVPQQLPEFTPLPHSRHKFGIAPDAALDWDGHLDVSFRITRFGNVRDIEVLAATDNVSSELERRLRRLLRSSPFRPRLIDGEPAVNDRVTLRYHFAHIDAGIN